MNLEAGSVYEVGSVVMAKAWSAVLSENVLLVFRALAMVYVVSFFVFARYMNPESLNFNLKVPINDT